MIVGALSHGPMRSNALQRAIPSLSHKVLTVTLRGLERDGLIRCTAFATIPPRVDYELTPASHSLREPRLTSASWARAQRGASRPCNSASTRVWRMLAHRRQRRRRARHGEVSRIGLKEVRMGPYDGARSGGDDRQSGCSDPNQRVPRRHAYSLSPSTYSAE